jgi:hypothetical protein
MKAISIHQPWAWLIVTGRKDIENRSWKTHYRGEILIHASLKFDSRPLSEIEDEYGVRLPPIDEMRRGGIVGRCELVDCVTAHRSKWFLGPYGFVLKNSRQLPFKKTAGQQRFWNYPRV